MKSFVEDNNELKAVFTFASFLEAVDFINQVADLAIQAELYPDLHLKQSKNVLVTIPVDEEESAQDAKELALKVEDIAPSVF